MLITIMIFSHENIMIFIMIYIVDIYHWYFRANPEYSPSIHRDADGPIFCDPTRPDPPITSKI